jgi:hypothetical protein
VRLEGFIDVSEIQWTETPIIFTSSDADTERFRVKKSVKDLLCLDLIDVAADPRGIACCRVGLEPSRRRLLFSISTSMDLTVQEVHNTG